MDASTPETEKDPASSAYSDAELRDAMELLFFSYRDFIGEPDAILSDYDFGRAHHRVIHFVGRNPDITVSDLLSVLKITKQSLSRVLSQLIREDFIKQIPGPVDRRQRLLSLTEKGHALEEKLSAHQRERIASAFKIAGPDAVEGFYQVLLNMMNNPKEFKKHD
ncbi:MAG: MarR family transcriptional regulator [Rhodospirillaceae bacterium]|jgi:DNA-binding MarR family transcriptional regulator|nr:MarR family transcriptional regulator [Rhodospirillaceae bacterium]MBT4590025.1 MarR family transcriptional regulator [Rhodospirillaceae bacterium]MBT4938443.1 MarR family transcriptional regulator [Rhodospirillaceae bacterium]MBT5941390.1 MarR family transcriptional regulator [Rhodospirillaceae bacterium]MBT7268024.1 MarR family transcriptional regulator [Rhodospirillaceae bacterium]